MVSMPFSITLISVFQILCLLETLCFMEEAVATTRFVTGSPPCIQKNADAAPGAYQTRQQEKEGFRTGPYILGVHCSS